ncbi:MAG: hypothetical protein SFV22_09415 [Saprospiraceae bacterium]|nr:hypothetical protein [Saprospiraceae bacterium]
MKRLIFNFICQLAMLFISTQTTFAQWTSTASSVYLDAANAAKNVGIGTASPTQKLHVAGGNILLNASTGTTVGNLYFGAGFGSNNMRLFYSNTNYGFLDLRTDAATKGLLFRIYNGSTISEKMRICASGNVGIGTTSPAYRLHVNSSAAASNVVLNVSDSENRRIFFVPKLALGGYSYASLANDAGIFWSDNNSQNNTAGFVIAPHHGSWTGLRLDADGSATLPGYRTTIGNGVSKLGTGSAYSSALNWGTSYVGFNATRHKTAGNWLFSGDGSNNGGGVMYAEVSGNLRFVTKASTGGGDATMSDADILDRTRMIIRNDGKVIIGDPLTSVPGAYRLYVREGILTEKVKVAVHGTANWADYVFEPDYALKPLEEVETYIKANKHLPNVPSAQEIVDNGLDLAEMQAKQMEKIEELMLYTIELNKRLVKLEAENAALRQQQPPSVKQ